MMTKTIRRFWDKVFLTQDQEGYKIYLDTYPLRLPQKSVLCVSQRVLGQKIVHEWQMAAARKGDVFSPESLPITRIVSTLIEKVKPNRQHYIEALIPYVNGDLLCYRADHPQELINQQILKWDPVLQWMENTFSIKLTVVTGIMPIRQDKFVIDKIRDYLNALSDEALTFFVVVMPLLGSVILATAMMFTVISAQEAYELAYLDEITQMETWGYDSERQQRLDKINREIHECKEFINYI